jgi:hypothetical protein
MSQVKNYFTSAQIIIYKSDDGNISVDTLLKDESIWLSQKSMGQLFDCSPENALMHLKSIYASGELIEETTTKDFLVVQKEGAREVSRSIKHYNLDAIISVGYRVNSLRGTQFRIWATQRLREYLLQGFTLNEQKLKTGKPSEYFDALQEKIREIRLSERVFYQKIKDIYTTAIDYDPSATATIKFFQTVQNKLLWAISQKTAAELVHARVDSTKPFLGMQSSDKKIEHEITKRDVSIAKNYLNEKEMKTLGLIVEQYLAFAENMAQSETPLTMRDWIEQLDLILQMNRKELLTHYGKVSHALAVAQSEREFEKYKSRQREQEKIASLRELEADLKKLKKSDCKL